MDKKHKITTLPDSEFLSFLYSERDRENSISQYPGWSIWAFGGVAGTMLCSAFAIIKNNDALDNLMVFYYISGIIALFLSFRVWFFLLKRQRGIDLAKVMFLWDVVPHVLIIFVLLFAVVAMTFIMSVDCVNPVFWIWLSIFVLLAGAYIVIVRYRDKIVPSYPQEVLFWSRNANSLFNALLGGLYGLAFHESFKQASGDIFNSSFELAICISVAIVSLYAFIKLNVENKVVREFDAIVDAYIYKGFSKEETYRAIVRNRMGYGVLDACSKELIVLQETLKQCHEEGDALEKIKMDLDKEDYDLEHFSVILNTLSMQVSNLRGLLKQSRHLADRLREINRVSSSMGDVDEVGMITEVNDNVCKETEMLLNKNDEITHLIQEKLDRIRSSMGLTT